VLSIYHTIHSKQFALLLQLFICFVLSIYHTIHSKQFALLLQLFVTTSVRSVQSDVNNSLSSHIINKPILCPSSIKTLTFNMFLLVGTQWFMVPVHLHGIAEKQNVKLNFWSQVIFFVFNIEFMIYVSVWDQAKLSRYNFVWWDVTSLQPYNGETQFESSLLVQKSGGLALSSLSNVFHSLTTNARSIFIIMVRYHLRNHKDPTYLGNLLATRMNSFTDCRARWYRLLISKRHIFEECN